MTNSEIDFDHWNFNVDDFIEWADGSIDIVWTNAATGEAEFKPATPHQIEMVKRHQAWVKAGCPAETISLSKILDGSWGGGET
jgi:hypothetical protein